MKKHLLFILIAGCIITSAKAQTKEGKKGADTTSSPGLLFDVTVVDYGSVPFDSDGTRELKFKNTGKSPLVIQNIISECSCLSGTIPKEPIKPGETGIIKLHYDTKKPGNFYKSALVFSNARGSVRKIYVKGNVVSKQEVKPQ